NDGDLDILLTGWDGNNPTSKIYKNEGDGIFSELANPIAGSSDLPGVTNSSVAWGDYDNDGDLDILLTGGDSSSWRFSIIYKNNGDGSFTELT
ncbi:VCBS repeat-containing protein, partial [Micrococcus sp. SIMBA_131]